MHRQKAKQKRKKQFMVIQAEEQPHAWCPMWRTMGKGKKSGLSSIVVKKEDGTTRRITDKAEMEEKLIEPFQKHYSQANGPPS
jgi:hypothetical protein